MIGGVGILVLLVATQIFFGARGSAAQTVPVNPSPWYFQAQPGNSCWGLAEEVFYDGFAQRCEELVAVNPQIHFSASGDPIIVAGDTYWLPVTWTQAFSTVDAGRHQLFRYPALTGESATVLPPPLTSAITQASVGAGEQMAKSGGSPPGFLIYSFGAGIVMAVLLAITAFLFRDRIWVRIPLPRFRSPFGSRYKVTT